MDPHPALIPVVKRRVAVNPTLKPTTVRPNAKKEKQTQPLAPAKTRPKRAFGVSRNTNIPVEKAQLKQPKPASVIAIPAKRNGTSAENAKLKPAESKKQLQQVLLNEHKEKRQEEEAASVIAIPAKRNGTSAENAKLKPTERKKQLQQVLLKELKEKRQEEAMRTPLAVAKKVVEDGTPYLSALNCSKCRLDRLETSSYWLNQVRLSEAVGKHFVSAAFFRLALECHAQPFEKIRSELKHYTKRHQTTSTISLFDDLLQSYGLHSEKTKPECTEILNSESKKEALFSDTHKDEFEEKADGFVCKTENFTLKEEHDCNSYQGLCLNISQEQPKSDQKQDEIVKTEHCKVANSDLIEEANDKLKQHVLKDCSNSSTDEGARKLKKKSPPSRGSLSNKISTTCLEKKSSTVKAGNSASEQSKSKGKQAAKNEKTEYVSIAKVEGPMEELASLTDSVAT